MGKNKSGNSFIFGLYIFFNLGIIGFGLLVMGLMVYEMTKIGFHILFLSILIAGLLTSLIGIVSFCGRGSPCIVCLNLLFNIILLIAYAALTILYWMDMVCKYIPGDNKAKCEELKNAPFNYLVKFVLLGADGIFV